MLSVKPQDSSLMRMMQMHVCSPVRQLRAMMPSFLCLVTLLSLGVVCLAGSMIIPREDYEAMRMVSKFRELHSPTNLPPEVVLAGAAGASVMVGDGKNLLAPARTWMSFAPARTWRLIWAVMDDRYYVVHTEYVPVYNDRTNYWVVVAQKTKAAQPRIYRLDSKRFENYRAFVSELKGPFWGDGP
jgi:hypothetical protein